MSQETTRSEADATTWAERQIDAARAEAAELASETKSRARQGVERVQSGLRREVGAVARRQQSHLVHRATAFADALTAAAATLEARQETWAGDRVLQAASQARIAAGYLETRDPQGLVDDLRIAARRNPGLYFGALLAGGIVCGRFLRSSRPEATGRDQRDAVPSRAAREGAVPTREASNDEEPGPAEVAEIPSTADEPSTFGAPPPKSGTYVHNWS